MHTPSAALLITAISLFSSLTKAIPHTLSVRETICPANSAFYACSLNDFRGCCSIDPCAIQAGCPDASPTSPSSSSAAAAPICQPGTKDFKQFNPTIITINSTSSDPSLLHITNTTSTIGPPVDVSQVLRFNNIPPTAKNIALKWYISKTAPQFSTNGTATAAITLLDSTKLPTTAGAPLTAQAVDAAVDDTVPAYPRGHVGGAGFGFWDGPEYKRPQDHIIAAAGLPVRGTLSFRIGITDRGEVVLRETGQDGLYLQYDC